MAGVKGRSGGRRRNTGGARPGAGRKPKWPTVIGEDTLQTENPKEFLTALMNCAAADIKERKDAAKALLSHEAKLAAAAGKKEGRQVAAQAAASGRFAPAPPPQLALLN